MPPALDLEPLLAAIRARATNAGSSLHGERHWQCVAHLGGDLAREVAGTDRLVVFLFGLLHDTMRETDGSDPEHGPRAAKVARELASDGLLPLDESQLDLLCDACERHTGGEVSTDPTTGVCWDADRLNLWRVGITPDPKLLSTRPARRVDWIDGAQALARHEFDWRALAAARGGSPTPESFWVEAGRVLAGKYPGSLDPDEARGKLDRLTAAGVTAFIDLTQPGELRPYSQLVDGRARHQRFPIRDLSTTDPPQMAETLDAIDHELARGGIGYVHCFGGCGRTGTVVGCWLVRHGVPAGVALARFASVSHAVCRRPCPEFPAQSAMVLEWSEAE